MLFPEFIFLLKLLFSLKDLKNIQHLNIGLLDEYVDQFHKLGKVLKA